MNKIINRLPKITSINRITQNIVTNQEVEEQQEDIPKPSVGFQLN